MRTVKVGNVEFGIISTVGEAGTVRIDILKDSDKNMNHLVVWLFTISYIFLHFFFTIHQKFQYHIDSFRE